MAEMDKQSRQAALNNLSKEDLEKVERFQQKNSSTPIDKEWMILAEFAMTFGWDAYKDADNITLSEMMSLLEASRKVQALRHYESAQAAFIGAASARSKKPTTAFKKATKNILNRIKIK